MLIVYVEPEDIKYIQKLFFRKEIKRRNKKYVMPPKEELLNHYADGKTYKKIASIYRVPAYTVGYWFKKINNPKLRVVTTNVNQYKFERKSS